MTTDQLIRELLDALCDPHFGFLPDKRVGEITATMHRARLHLKAGGWTKVSDGLPVVPDGKKSVPIYVVIYSLVLRTHATAAYSLGGLVGVTHWRYAERTPEPPEG